jgi:microcystin-dependent protein
MEGTIGEIRMFAANFAPRNWALCQGQLLAIASNNALFAILGTTYGGDGRTTFALPDLRGRAPIGSGQGPGLSNYRLGQKGGQQDTTLTVLNLPSHTHTATGSVHPGAFNGRGIFVDTPAGNYPASGTETIYGKPPNANLGESQASITIGITGGSQYFNIQQPLLGMNYIICLFGIFPSRN